MPDVGSSEVFASSALGRRRRGRPTKGAAASLSEGILQIAFRQFLEAGYAATSMDAVAAEARVSKRTLYDRFPSKGQLFEAALQQQVALNHEEFGRFESLAEPFEAVLVKMAFWLRENTLAPRTISLYRLLAAEGHRNQELANYSEDKLVRPVVLVLSRIFSRAIERGDITDLPTDFLANQFLQAVCGRDARSRIYGFGGPADAADADRRAVDSVHLFLYGARPRVDAGAGTSA